MVDCFQNSVYDHYIETANAPGDSHGHINRRDRFNLLGYFPPYHPRFGSLRLCESESNNVRPF